MRLVLLVGCALALSLGAAVAGASDGATAPPQFRDSIVPTTTRALRLASPAGTTGGTYTTANGATVEIYAADAYIATDPSFNQRWADFLATAPHGDELSRVTVVFLSLPDVQSACGARALACYSPGSETIVTPGDDPAPELPAASILLHEYGHHVAANRSNAPWAAIDYGPKRWASDQQICRGTKEGALHPGDEGADYRLNPGEAWAETYRVVAESSVGLPSAAWGIVSRVFYPTDTSLAAASADVLDPWSGNTATTVAGSFRGIQKQRRVQIATRYDGSLALTFGNRTRSALKLRLVDGSEKLVATATVASGRSRTIRSSICGQRSLQLRVSRTATGAGSYAVTISRP